MFLACGIGAYTAAVFHVMTHAFFKALLFLSAGSVIHALSGEQDIRKMGGLSKKIPWTYRLFLIGTIAIAGIPPLAGFWSKDEIMGHAFVNHQFLFYGLAAIGAFLTSFYMFRLTYLTFYGPRMDHHTEEHVHESPMVMVGPLMALGVLSVFGDSSWDSHRNMVGSMDSWPPLQASPADMKPACDHPASYGNGDRHCTRRVGSGSFPL